MFLYIKEENKLMLSITLLAGHLWRGFSVCAHAAFGVTYGRDDTVNVKFTDLDRRRRHT